VTDALSTWTLTIVLAAAQTLAIPDAEKIARAARGRVGAAAIVVETGESAGFHGGDQFPMQSVYKFPIGMAVLHQVDTGRLQLDQPIQIAAADLLPRSFVSPIRDAHPTGATLPLVDVLRFMVETSDGTASDVLLRLAGGPAGVMSYLRGIGVTGMVVATSERAMAAADQVQYRNWSTPAAMADLFRKFQEGEGLSAASRALLMKWLTETTTFPGRLKGQLPAGTVVAHKTGSSGVANGLARATNDAGLITLPDGRHLAIAVFVSDAKADDATRDRVIAELAMAAWQWAIEKTGRHQQGRT
jgi:beta-lactamase class A